MIPRYEARIARQTEDYEALVHRTEKLQRLNTKFETAGVGLEQKSSAMTVKYDEVLQQYEVQEARVSVLERQLHRSEQENHELESSVTAITEKCKRLEKHNQELREVRACVSVCVCKAAYSS